MVIGIDSSIEGHGMKLFLTRKVCRKSQKGIGHRFSNFKMLANPWHSKFPPEPLATITKSLNSSQII